MLGAALYAGRTAAAVGFVGDMYHCMMGFGWRMIRFRFDVTKILFAIHFIKFFKYLLVVGHFFIVKKWIIPDFLYFCLSCLR